MAVLGEGCRRRLELNRSGRLFIARNNSLAKETFSSLRQDGGNDAPGAKNGIHRGYDLVHGSVDVERETDEVHILKCGMCGSQDLPRRITAEFNRHDLVIAVAQVAHPAQEIAKVNQAGQRSGGGQQAYVVVTASGVHQLL